MLYTERYLADRVDDFTEMIRNTQEYKDYKHMQEVLERKPDLYDQVMIFRKENYILQHAPDHEDIYERVEELRKKNEDLLNIPEVYDFLMTEWTFFHMMQNLFDRLMNGMDF